MAEEDMHRRRTHGGVGRKANGAIDGNEGDAAEENEDNPEGSVT